MVRCFSQLVSLCLTLLLLAGCARRDAACAAGVTQGGLRKVVLQTDWFPEAEHGGFYQAQAKGFYRAAGLEVDIRPGGMGAPIKLPVAKGDADFGLNRSDDVIVTASRGLPIVMVAAVFQHDPQALLVHDESPVRTWTDLKGRTVTAPLSMTWIPFVQEKYGIDFALKPLTGMAAFLGDKDAIQQCLVTNEPFYARQHGVLVRTLPLVTAGYDVYHAVICRRALVRESPEVVRAFVTASIRGWRDYLLGDPAPAHALILKSNAQMTPELLAFSRDEIIQRSLVTGDPARGEEIGQLSPARLGEQIDTLLELKMIDAPVAVGAVATREFLPPAPR